MKQYLMSQFGRPRGIVGWFVGQIMAYENRERITWAISQLDVQHDDHVLEIGVGPGLAIKLAAEKAKEGFVAGIDLSETMIRQAKQRNIVSIHEGCVQLRQADVSALPFESDSFDKVFAINSFHHWLDPVAGLRESLRVLRPGGLIALMEQPHGAISELAIRQRGADIVAQLRKIGFHESKFVYKPLSRGPAVYVKGVKALDNGG